MTNVKLTLWQTIEVKKKLYLRNAFTNIFVNA